MDTEVLLTTDEASTTESADTSGTTTTEETKVFVYRRVQQTLPVRCSCGEVAGNLLFKNDKVSPVWLPAGCVHCTDVSKIGDDQWG